MTATVVVYVVLAAGCLAVLADQAHPSAWLNAWPRTVLAVVTLISAVTITVPLGFGNKYEEIDITGAGLGVAIALIGPAPAGLVLIGAKVLTELVKRRQPVKALANVSAFAIAATVACELAKALSDGRPHLGPHEWPGVAVAAVAFTLLLAILINGIIYLSQHHAWMARVTPVNLLNAATDAVLATAALAEWRFQSVVVLLTPVLAWAALRLYRNTTTHDDEGSVLNGLAKASTAVSTLDPKVAMKELADRCTELFGVSEMEIDLLNWPPDESTWHFSSDTSGKVVFGGVDVEDTPESAERSVSTRKWWQTYPITVDGELLGELRMQAGERTPRRAERQIMDAFLATTTTALHHARGHLRELQAARRDPLTRLINRAGFAELITDIIAGKLPLDPSRAVSPHPAAPKGDPAPEVFAVLFLDLNLFKPINDKYGHQVGDEALVNVARRLKNNIRTMDEVARIGGDEFVILLRNIESARKAEEIAKDLLHRIREPMTMKSVPLSLKVSGTIGVVTSLDAASVEELTRCADIAMYQAKSNGRGTVAVYEPSIAPEMPADDDLLDDLETAINEGQLLLHYQPKVHLLDGKIVGSEALVRWEHPTRGFLGPGQFLPAVEKHPLIVDLTMEVLRMAVSEAGTWRNKLLPVGVDPPTVAVNVARDCLTHRDFPSHVTRLLAVHGVPCEMLILEITESSELGTSEIVDDVVAELRRLGIKLSLDDFGQGHSGLTIFRRVPFDEVKIDGQYVREMATNRVSAAIAHSAIGMGHSVDMSVVAEGIETAEQLAEITAAGADIGQGYFLHKPMPVREFRVLLHDHFHDAMSKPPRSPGT